MEKDGWTGFGPTEREQAVLRVLEDIAARSCITPMQCPTRHRPDTALRRLHLALLSDAIDCHFERAVLQSQDGAVAKRARLKAQADQWFASEAMWSFAFLTTCDVLGINPHYVRKLLKTARARLVDHGRHGDRRVLAQTTPSTPERPSKSRNALTDRACLG